MQVSPHVVAAYHQHLFCARLDLAVDCDEGGKNLVVSEVSVNPCCHLSTTLSTLRLLPSSDPGGGAVQRLFVLHHGTPSSMLCCVTPCG